MITWHSQKFTKLQNNFLKMGYMREGETEKGRREETGGGSDLLLSTTKDKGLSVRPWLVKGRRKSVSE